MTPHLFRGLRPRALSFDGSVPAHGTDGHRFAHRRAGGGERFFLPNSCHSIWRLSGVSPPDPDLLFPRRKSRQKGARREKPFRWGFSPVTPSSATTQRGQSPLWNPPSIDGTYPKFLWMLPRVRLKNHVSTSTNRNIYLFKRAAAEASLTTKPQIRCQNEIQWQGTLPTDKDRLGKKSGTGVSPAAFWSLFRRGKSDPGCGAGEAPHAIE